MTWGQQQQLAPDIVGGQEQQQLEPQLCAHLMTRKSFFSFFSFFLFLLSRLNEFCIRSDKHPSFFRPALKQVWPQDTRGIVLSSAQHSP